MALAPGIIGPAPGPNTRGLSAAMRDGGVKGRRGDETVLL
jgi:hypothetical protein